MKSLKKLINAAILAGCVSLLSPPSSAVELTIDLAACDMPSADFTICQNLNVPIPNGDPLWIDFDLNGDPLAHIVQLGPNVLWRIRVEFTNVVQPGTLALTDMDGVIPGFEAIGSRPLCNQCDFEFTMAEPIPIHDVHLSSVNAGAPIVLSLISFNTFGEPHEKGLWVPAPATLALLGIGLAGMGFNTRRAARTRRF